MPCDKKFKDIIDKEIEKINKEIPVYFVYGTEIVRIQKENRYDDILDPKHTYGTLVISKKRANSKLPPIYLWIRKGYDYVLPWRAFHEYGHFVCLQKGCRCMDKALNNGGEDLLCEYHANMFALKKVMEITSYMDYKNSYLMCLATTFFIEDEIREEKSVSIVHKKALIKVCKTKIYSKFIGLRNSFAKKAARK